MNKKSWMLAGAAGAGALAYWRQTRTTTEETEAQRPFATQYGPWAIVTGAARAEGLGYGFARRLAGRHLNLVLVDVQEAALHARAAELRERYFVKVKPVVLDLGQPDFITHLLAETQGLEIGLLICNHMVTPKETPTILEMDLATHHLMLDVNARAYTTLIHTYGRQMAAQGRGGVIIVSSQGGLCGTPYTGAYAANKAFQLALGESLWYELRGSGVDVEVLAPGLTDTQGDGLAGYPQVMVMPVEPVVTEALARLGREHLVIPGPVNKLFNFVTTRLMSRRQALITNGDFMRRGLGK